MLICIIQGVGTCPEPLPRAVDGDADWLQETHWSLPHSSSWRLEEKPRPLRAMEIEGGTVGFARWFGLELAFGWSVVMEGGLDLTQQGTLPARFWLKLEVFRMQF